MNTTITRARWTRKEDNLAKETLKMTKGNQKNAAILLSERLDRSVSSIQVRLCTLAKKHPSLRKKNIERKMARIQAQPVVMEETPVEESIVRTVKSLQIKGNQLIITF